MSSNYYYYYSQSNNNNNNNNNTTTTTTTNTTTASAAAAPAAPAAAAAAVDAASGPGPTSVAYAPRSPDLSFLKRDNVVVEPYRPRSPQIPAYYSSKAPAPIATYEPPISPITRPQFLGPGFAYHPGSSQYQHPQSQQQVISPIQSGGARSSPTIGGMAQAASSSNPDTSGPSQGIEIRTKFPVARIKRIMQADEEVGKVAQVTPVAVSKALELFMISLCTKSADIARNSSSKRVTAAHLKAAIESDEQFDFLNEITSKVVGPPAPTEAPEKKGRGRAKAKVEADSEEEGAVEVKKVKPTRGRKKREA